MDVFAVLWSVICESLTEMKKCLLGLTLTVKWLLKARDSTLRNGSLLTTSWSLERNEQTSRLTSYLGALG